MKLAPKLALPFALSLSFAWLQLATVAHAEEHRGDEHHETHADQHHDSTPSTTRCTKADARCRLPAPRRRSSSPTRPASTRMGRWCARTPFA